MKPPCHTLNHLMPATKHSWSLWGNLKTIKSIPWMIFFFNLHVNISRKVHLKKILLQWIAKYCEGLRIKGHQFHVGNCKFKVSNRNTRTRCKKRSKLPIKMPEQRQWLLSGVFIVNCEHNSHLVLMFL